MRKITFLAAFLTGFYGLVAQNHFQVQEAPQNTASAVEKLLDRLDAIGTTSGDVNEYFTKNEQRMLNVHFNGLQNLAPVTITQTTTQNIVPGAGIACANAIRFTDNSLYRAFDLVGDHGLTNGLQVESVQFGFDEGVSTPDTFPVYIYVYSIDDVSDFPADYQNMTLEGSAIYEASNVDSETVVDVAVDAVIPPGKAMVVELALIDDGTESNYMRFACNMDGDIASAYIMAPECGAATPTSFTDLGLDNNLILSVLGNDEPGGSGGEPVIFGIENASEQLVSFEVEDTTLEVIGSSPAVEFENAGAVDPNNTDTAYVLDSQGAFYEVDLTNGAYTSLGSIPPAASQSWTGAEFDPTTGILYAVSGDLASTGSLYKIDIDNVSKELIGTNSAHGVISLMINGNGDGFIHDIASDAFYEIDIATGATFYVGDLGFDANFGQGGTWVPGDDDHVYLSAFNSDTFQAEWRQVNIATGMSTLIAPIFLNGELAQIGWSSASGIMLAVGDNELEGFTFYPNPAQDMINLRAENPIDNVKVFNVVGQKVLDVEIGSNHAGFNVSTLNPGVYLMKISSNGETGTYRIIRN